MLGGSPRFSPAVFLTRPRVPDATLFAELIASIFRERWFTNDGALVRRLEADLRERLGVGFLSVFCNGTVALQVALRSLGLRGEVITTPFTFPATVHSVEWNSLSPVFCDIDPDTYNLDPASAESLVTGDTAALLPVHVFGTPCDVDAIARLASRHGLSVVYDACHAFGVVRGGTPIGRFGDLSVLSFHATKLFHTAEGGAIVGPDERLAPSVKLLRNFGIVNEDEVLGVGLNGKMSELSAAVGLALLSGIDEEIALRGSRAARYHEGLAEMPGLRWPAVAANTVPNHAYLPVEVDPEAFGLTRNELHAALRAEGIVTRRYFHPLCSENIAYRDLPSARPERLPVAHRVAARVLCLPLYGELPMSAVEAIVEAIREVRAAAPRVRAVLAGSL